ncbi:hypothetical protein [Hymenobacter glacieicola]|uniref:Uncharacterized protein n=1 Tax=Hymenobacter glacieicola TaxID=1562124 RepID=A0ABQ1WDE3_9BACT|nr:hypothetical protein [Hymenobacter glacieicola]GGG27258.1 hypothetical protein GCM10011378_00060 [Hymenobacter glacieicola]
MKKLIRGLLTGGCLLWPVLAVAGEREEKYAFLLTGGVGGVAIGLGMYAFFMILVAALYRRKQVVAALFALCTTIFLYLEYWSFRLLTFSVNFLQTKQVQPVPGQWPLVLKWGLAVVLALAVVIFVLACRMWRKWHPPRGAVPATWLGPDLHS